MRIAKNSLNWILTPTLFAIIFLILQLIIKNSILKSIFFLVGIILFILTFFFIVFFRDPDRKTGYGIVSPADGKIREIKKKDDKDLGRIVKISIFMNMYNVHVNRMPIDGKIVRITHKKGSYVPAFKKESERNERMIADIKTVIGMIRMILIAGTIARRIVLYVKEDEKTIKKGERIGIIRLGSRVDICIPQNKISKINVKEGDIVLAGETTIAEIDD